MMRTALGIDPGSSKCGLALVRNDGQVILMEVVETEVLQLRVSDIISEWKPDVLVLGNGTGSKQTVVLLSAKLPEIELVVMDEAYTSEAARSRFLRENPAKGLQRMIPSSLRTPDRSYDDYVAVILCERYFAKEKVS